MMEEIQLQSKYHGKNHIVRSLYKFILSVLPIDIQLVEAYANKRNLKSQQILSVLGLNILGECDNGQIYHYRGTFQDLKDWVLNKVTEGRIHYK